MPPDEPEPSVSIINYDFNKDVEIRHPKDYFLSSVPELCFYRSTVDLNMHPMDVPKSWLGLDGEVKGEQVMA